MFKLILLIYGCINCINSYFTINIWGDKWIMIKDTILKIKRFSLVFRSKVYIWFMKTFVIDGSKDKDDDFDDKEI